MKQRKRYTDEFKTQALELCAIGKPVAEVAADLCVSKDLIYTWRRKASQASSVAEEKEPKATRTLRRNWPGFGERSLSSKSIMTFKKGCRYPGNQEPESPHQMIDDIHKDSRHSVPRICDVLGLARSSCYSARLETARQKEDQTSAIISRGSFACINGVTRYRRIVEELADEGIACSDERARRLMKQRGLLAIQPKTYVPRTSDGRAGRPVSESRRAQGISTRPNQVLAGDITHIPTSQGWLYLAVVIDLGTRKIVGWK